MSRAALIEAFLARHGFARAHSAPLAQDASFRRYLRLTGGPRRAVLMDAPPPEDVRPFLRMAAHLAGIGVSVPEIIAADPEAGLVLEEDLGDGLVSVLLDGQRLQRSETPPPPLVGGGWGEGSSVADSSAGSYPRTTPPPIPLPQGEGDESAPAASLLNSAVETLIAIQRAAPPPGLPDWDSAAMAQTALGTLLDWWWPAAFGAAPPQAARDDFTDALHAMVAPLTAAQHTFVHRDYFAGNLLWLPDRAGIRRIGVLDFQSAALGHPAYDLASLLQDARRDIPAEIAEHCQAHYLALRPELDEAEFRAAYAVCAAQRHLRVACQWVRLAQRDGRPQYLAYGPRTWRLLKAALCHPATAPLAGAMDRWIPRAMRGNPKALAA